jgi:hypothetical protein
MLRPMAVKSIPPGDVVIVLMFVAAAVAMAGIAVPPEDKGIAPAFTATAAVAAIVGGGEGVRNIVLLLGEIWV